jgi:hypothetical protein
MSSNQRATAARISADPVAQEARLSLAALFDVLERADIGPLPARSPRRHPAAHRPAGARRGAVRTVPLRSVQPAPMARPVPGAARAPEATPLPVSAPGRWEALTRRAALWGAGPQGEYLAWRPAARASARATGRPAVRTPARPARPRGLLRRIALWGAGTDGKYLAWGGPARPADKPVADRPVVLREMPSTPLIQTPPIQPTASSPAAVLTPRRPAPAGPRWMPPVPRGAVAVPGVRPSGPPERSRATGWPPQASGSGVPTGLVRARGDPLSSPARGSPGPARRSRSPNSSRSSFP